MGVWGLQTYMEREQPNSCYRIHIEQVVQDYRSTTNRTPVVVCDLSSCYRPLYSCSPWIPGGQIKVGVEQVRRLCNNFKSMGVELVFFVDGTMAPTKMDIWRKRRIDSLQRMYDLYDSLEKSPTNWRAIQDDSDTMNLSPNVTSCSIHAIKECGFKVYQTVLECDEELAKYAGDHQCLAVLAQDSDFVIFPGAKYYWSVKWLDLDSMTTLCHDRDKFAKSLGLPSFQLPLLATLLGNDIVPRNDLMHFHNRLGCRGRPFGEKIRRVASYIHQKQPNHFGESLYIELAETVYRDSSRWTTMRDSVLSYDIQRSHQYNLDEIKSNNKKWDRILKLTHKFHVHGSLSVPYNVIVRGFNCSALAVDDFRRTDLPPTQLIEKKLRRKHYGILLYDKPQEVGKPYVEELFMIGPNSMKEDVVQVLPIPPRVFHPGIEALWEGTDPDLDTVRWNLFCDVFDIDPVSAQAIPQKMIVPVFALKYLMDEGLKLRKWELHVILAAAILTSLYTVEQLRNLELPRIDTKAIRLFNIISVTYSNVVYVCNSCGWPVAKEHALATNYQDGMLFHIKYNLAKNGAQQLQLIEHKVDLLEKILLAETFLPLDLLIP